MTLSKFLGSLPIESASEITFDLILEKHPTLEEVLSLTKEELASIGSDSKKSIGLSRATKIWDSLHSDYILSLLKYKDLWVKKEEPVILSSDTQNFFYGKRVCFTGTAPVPRKELTSLLKGVGAIVKDSVTKDLDYLLIEDVNSQSSKAQNARKNNIPIMTYIEAMPLIKKG